MGGVGSKAVGGEEGICIEAREERVQYSLMPQTPLGRVTSRRKVTGSELANYIVSTVEFVNTCFYFLFGTQSLLSSCKPEKKKLGSPGRMTN